MNKNIKNNKERATGLWLSMSMSVIIPMAFGLLLSNMFSSWRWSNYPFHSMVESVGSVSALTIATLMIIMLKNRQLPRYHIMVACALISMGLLDGFHAVLHVGVSFVWLHSIATFAGGTMFAMVWFPEVKFTDERQKLLVFSSILLSLLIGVVSVVFPNILPEMVVNGHFSTTAKVLNITGGIAFLVGTLYFVNDYKKVKKEEFAGKVKTEDMVFANHCLLFGIAGLLFETSVLWDAGWWWWHILRLMAYLVVLVYFFMLFNRRQKEFIRSEKKLQKTLDEQVNESANNRMLFDASPVGLALTDMEGNLVDVNQAYADILGRKIYECYSLSYWDVTPIKYEAEEQVQLESLQKNGHYGPYEKEYLHKDGHLVPVRLSGLIIERNQKSYIWSSIENISDVKKANLELEKHREHLEVLVSERTKELHNAQDELVRKERLATLGQLTATVSHELRNPLGAIRPSLYVIEKRSNKDDERLQQAIQRVDRNVDRCDNIIDELLDFTRITELKLELTRFDDWLEQVIVEQDIPDAILLKKDFNLTNVELFIDRDRLRRVIINIIDNGCHAMMDNNQQVVTSNACLTLTTSESKHHFEIKISDTGIGISKDILSKIFEPLFSTKGFGVGLGMPTVKQIMEQHYGGVEVNSEENKGTQVIVRLPKHSSNGKGDAA